MFTKNVICDIITKPFKKRQVLTNFKIPYACHLNQKPLLNTQGQSFQKKLLENKETVFKKWVKNIQTAGYNALVRYITLYSMTFFCPNSQQVHIVEEYLKKSFQHLTVFSCLLDEGLLTINKKINSHNGFLRADQDRAKSTSKLTGLQVAQKAIMGIQFLEHFCNPLIN